MGQNEAGSLREAQSLGKGERARMYEGATMGSWSQGLQFLELPDTV